MAYKCLIKLCCLEKQTVIMASGSVGFDFDLGGQHSGQHYLLLKQKDSPWWHWKLYWNPLFK